jgi:hypothetical protein
LIFLLQHDDENHTFRLLTTSYAYLKRFK